MKFERFVALRYLTRRKGLFAIITTLIGVAGVSVGVAALITTLSVMNGFQSDIKTKVIGAQSHILVFGRMPASTYPEQIRKIEQIPLVEAAARIFTGRLFYRTTAKAWGWWCAGWTRSRKRKSTV